MPTVNLRLLWKLLLGLSVFAALWVSLYLIQAQRIPDILRQQAVRAEERKELSAAIQFLQRYLQFRPKDKEVALKLADLLMERSRSTQSYGQVLYLYEQILRQDPSADEVREKLVQICLDLGRYTDAQSHIHYLMDKGADSGKLWDQLGTSYLGLNQFADARTALEKAIHREPTLISSYERLSNLLVNQFKEIREAEKALKKLVEQNPKDAISYLIRARFYKNQNRIKESEADVKRAVTIDPDHPEILLLQAELAQLKGEIFLARALLTTGLKSHPKDVRFYRSLSWLEISAGNTPSALSCLEKGIQELPDEIELLTPLGDMFVQQNDAAKVEETIRKMERKKAPSTQIRYLRGRLLMLQKRWQEAIATFEPLSTEAVGVPIFSNQLNIMIALCQDELNHDNEEIDALQKILATDPAHLTARMMLGNRNLQRNDMEGAIREFTIASRSPYVLPATENLLAELRIQRARVYHLNADEWQSIGQFIQKLKTKYPSSIDPLLLQASWQHAQNKIEEAMTFLREQIGKRANEPRLWVKLAEIARSGLGISAALEVLDEAQATMGDAIELKSCRARCWLLDPILRNENRLPQFLHELSIYPDIVQIQALAQFSDWLIACNDMPNYAKTVAELAIKLPKDRHLRQTALQVLPLAAPYQNIRSKLLQQLNALEKDFPYSQTALEYWIELQSNNIPSPKLQEIIAWSKEQLNRFPKDGLVLGVLAQAEAKMEKPLPLSDPHSPKSKGNANKTFALALRLEPGNLMMNKSYLYYLLDHQQIDQVLSYLQHRSSDPRLGVESLQYLLRVVLEHPNGTGSIPIARWIDQRSSYDAEQLVWLSNAFRQKKRFLQANRFAQLSCQIAPSLLDGWAGQIDSLIELNRTKEALQLLKSLSSKFRTRKPYYQICAICATKIKQVDSNWHPEYRNQEEYDLFARTMVARSMILGRPGQAITFLEKQFDQNKASANTNSWARRHKLFLVGMLGNDTDRQNAITHLEKGQEEQIFSVDDARVEVTLLAATAKTASGPQRHQLLQQAIELMNKIVSSKEQQAKDWFLLANLYQLIGNHPDYQKCMYHLIQIDGNHLSYRIQLMNEFIGENRLDKAVELLSPPPANSDSNYTWMETKIRIACLQNQPSTALKYVNDYLQSKGTENQNAFVRTRNAALLLDELGRVAKTKKLDGKQQYIAKAIAQYQLILRQFPDTYIPYTALLAWDDRVTEAFDILETLPNTSKTTLKMDAGVAILRSISPTPKQIHQVQLWIEEGLKREPNSVKLLSELAETQLMDQQYSSAEQTYRGILQIDAKNIIALNNLAYLLAAQPNTIQFALACIEKAIASVGSKAELLDTRARIRITQNDLPHAEEDLLDAIQQDKTASRCFQLALLRYQQKKENQALEAFREAQKLNLTIRDIHPADIPLFKKFRELATNP